ncbi:MAG: FAD-binding domain-containing protein [Chitinophagaceae bacterium]
MEQYKHLGFPTEYEKALERVNAIDPIKYAKTRNFINGQITYLSPYISRGVISTKQVMEKIIEKQYPYPAIEKIIQELAWREFFQRVWQTKLEQIWDDLKQDQQEVVHHQMITSIQKANTGIESIDFAINGLYEKGYMHNHSRMYLASIACNIGKAHWIESSRWMYYHLLDGDIASNNCSWQWVAGAFSSKKYYCNQENVNKYTFSKQQNTFLDKPYEQLVDLPIPDALQETTVLDLTTNLPKFNTPNIDTELPTLIYNSYNLDPIWRKLEKVNRVLLLEPSHFNQYPVSDKVIEFIIDLSKNIEGIQVYTGEIADIENLYKTNNTWENQKIISKEHPAFAYYPGIKDQRDWMFPEVNGYYPSFFGFWKKAVRSFRKLLISHLFIILHL